MKRFALRACQSVWPWAVIHVALCLGIIWQTFPTRNEVAHLPAGLNYILTGQFHVYRVNPPLTRLIQALPVWAVGFDPAGIEHIPDGHAARPEWAAAAAFADRNAGRYMYLFAAARLTSVAWSLLGMILVRAWCHELYGRRAAALASALWTFGPSVLAHATLVTPDMPCAVACLAATYSFHGYLRKPTWAAAYRSGLLLGVSQLTKFTALVDCAVWVALGVIAIRVAPAGPAVGLGRRAAHGAVIAIVCLAIVNLGYGCEGVFTRLGEFDFTSHRLSVDTDRGRQNAFADSWIGQVPVPLPANYVRGLDLQQVDFEGGKPSYLRGEQRDRGWWYFYLYALAVKVPVGTLVLGALGAAVSLARRYRRFDELVVWAPAVALFAVSSLKTGYTMHFRYVLPALPFLLVGLSKVAERRGWQRAVVMALAGWAVCGSLFTYPHSLAYFNELAGGPRNGDAHLIDSNLDWGQDLMRLKTWVDEHPEAEPIHLAYQNFVDYRVSGLPKLASIPWDPERLAPGYYILDVQSLHEPGRGYFNALAPIARIGYSIRVYHLTPDDLRRLRGD